MTRRAGGAHADVAYFCKLPEAPLDAMLVEIPKWMFDAAHCATLRLTEQPHVDCATLRALKNSITEQRVSVKTSVLQRQLSQQAGHGDKDDSDSKSKSDAQLKLFELDPVVSEVVVQAESEHRPAHRSTKKCVKHPGR